MWVLVEKVKLGQLIVKARLVVRGLEDTSDVKTDSQTVRKGNINIVLMVAARGEFVIRSQDVSSAFLKSAPTDM